MLLVWVTEPARINATDRMRSASGERISNCWPYANCEGASAILGRGPRCRYGGVKISTVLSSTGFSGFQCSVLPATNTRPLRSKMDDEWYIRSRLIGAKVFHRSEERRVGKECRSR